MAKFNIGAAVSAYGVDNIRIRYTAKRDIQIPFWMLGGVEAGVSSVIEDTASSLYKITERRYKVADDYKVELEPLEKWFGYKSFYQMDFNNIIADGRTNYLSVFAVIDGELKEISHDGID